MSELLWHELYPPRDVTLVSLTRLLRTLASRPVIGLTRQTPVVVFEQWIESGTTRWLLGLDARLSGLVSELRAQFPGLELTASRREVKPDATTRRLAVPGGLHVLRLDTATSVSAGLFGVAADLRLGDVAVVQWIVGPVHSRKQIVRPFRLGEALGLQAEHPPGSAERTAWKQKVSEPLFGVRGHVGAWASNETHARHLLQRVIGNLSYLDGPHAAVVPGRLSRSGTRQLSSPERGPRRWSLINAAELAALLGWPLDDLEVPNPAGGQLHRAPKRLLVTSAASYRHRVLGVSLHPADRAHPVTLPVHSSLHHLHVVGPTGSGKSTLLAGLVLGDIRAGRSVLVIEPKGDLVDDILARLPEHRHDDVVVVDPADIDRPVGFNPLTGPRDQAERRADQIVHLFHELYERSWGPRTSDVLLHALIAVCRLPDGTLTDVPPLLTNAGYRRRVLAKVNDPLTLAPFWAWYDALSEAERGPVTAPVLNKLRAFLSRTVVRRMLGQTAPSLDLDRLFSGRRIVLVSLNRGALGPEASGLLGALLVSQLWQAIQRRSAVPRTRRSPVMAYVDEFQDYVRLPLDFGDVLAQARGLGVGLTLAHQHLGQLSPRLQAAVLANARSRVVFRPAEKDLRELAAHLGEGVTDHDLARLGAYQACVRLLVDAAMTPAFSVATPPPAPLTADVTQLRQHSRIRHGVDGAQIDAHLTARWTGETPTGDVGLRERRTR